MDGARRIPRVLMKRLKTQVALAGVWIHQTYRLRQHRPIDFRQAKGVKYSSLGVRCIFQEKAPMSYSPILVVHICSGTLGLLFGTVAVSVRKGSHRHVLAGKVFVASMLTMGVGQYIWQSRSINPITSVAGF